MSEIPPEFAGMARQFISDVAVDNERASLALLALQQPVLERLDRRPHSFLRDGTLTALARAWEAIPRRFRLGIHSEIDRRGRRGLITEAYIAPCNLAATDWASTELAVMITGCRLEHGAKGLVIEPVDFASVGFHALGRRYERGRDRSRVAMLADLAVLAVAAIDHGSKRTEEMQFRVSVQRGYWLGVLAEVRILNEKPGRQFVVRTYIDADQ